MTRPTPAGPGGTRVSAKVDRYDAVKGYGFLDPGDGSPVILCDRSVLDAVGMNLLLPGATVACETEWGQYGPEVSRIHAVDFSTVPSGTASIGRVSGEGSVAANRGPAPAAAASGRRLRAVVKWFLPVKGYGFLEPEDGSADLFCHLTAVRASGHDTLPQGAAVTCEIVQGDRGPQVSRILSVEAPPAGPGPANRGGPRHGPRDRVPRGEAPPAADMRLPGTVKFYDPVRGFGFVVPDNGGREVFFHSSVLLRSGMGDLQTGQRVNVRAEQTERGLQATDIEPT